MSVSWERKVREKRVTVNERNIECASQKKREKEREICVRGGEGGTMVSNLSCFHTSSTATEDTTGKKI